MCPNIQGTITTGRIKRAQKVSKKDNKGDFSSTMVNIDSKYDPFIHFTIKFNSRDYSKSFCQEYSIQKLIQKFKFGFIQFKIFIQLQNQGIEHH